MNSVLLLRLSAWCLLVPVFNIFLSDTHKRTHAHTHTFCLQAERLISTHTQTPRKERRHAHLVIWLSALTALRGAYRRSHCKYIPSLYTHTR